MKRPFLSNGFWARTLFLALAFSLLAPLPVRADVAPPESPLGSGISPGDEVIEVRMVLERVTLTILPTSQGNVGQARAEALFQMRNLGTAAETMDGRFPLLYGESLYYSDMFPEPQDFQVRVDGKLVSTRRINSPAQYGWGDIPWAVFPVTFPPGQDVNITVT